MIEALDSIYKETLELLRNLIKTQSFSREEEQTANIINEFLTSKGVETNRLENNIWAKNKFFDESKPTILLNSHHDTVKPNKGYTRDPYDAKIENGKLFGLGSNDAGGCLVSLISTFVYFYNQPDLKYNFILAATAEEEISGTQGLELLYPHLGDISFAIVGEPTIMNAAVAEKGLMVIDCTVEGKAGHAARDEGINALYLAMEDIAWIKNHTFEKVSPYLGPAKMTVTIVNAGSQHNVVPKECVYTIDVRLTEDYTHEDIVELLETSLKAKIKPRSWRLRPSFIDEEHPVVVAAKKFGANTYGSPTTSDQALIPVPSLKMGPGDSARSHMADEFIFVDEIRDGIEKYIKILNEIVL